LWILAEAVEGHEEAVCAGVEAALDEVGSGQFDERDVAQWRDQMLGLLHEPGARRGLLHGRCWDHLQGGKELTWEELRQNMQDVGQEDVTQAANGAAAQSLYRFPEGYRPQSEHLAPAPLWSAREFSGRSFPVVRLSRKEPLHTMVAGDEGVTLRRADATVGIPYESCEVLLRWPDGHRALIGADGTILEVAPEAWVDGADLVSTIDRGVAAERHVDMPEVAGATPMRAVVEPPKHWFFVVFFAGLTIVTGGTVLGGGDAELAAPLLWGACTAAAVFVLVRARMLRGLRGFPTRWRAKQ
jgi:hypothetical protein